MGVLRRMVFASFESPKRLMMQETVCVKLFRYCQVGAI